MALKRDGLRPAADSPNHPDNQVPELWEPKGEDLDIVAMATTDAPPGREILPGMEEGSLGMMLGGGSSSKSMHAMQMAVQLGLLPSVQASWPWAVLPARSEQLRVVYTNLEDPPRQVHSRIRNMLRNVSETEVHRLSSYLRIRDMRLEPPDILQDRWLDQFHGYMQDRDLLILDTWRRAQLGDENDGGVMARALGGLETLAANTNCAVLIIHHMAKHAFANGTADTAQAGRGSSVLTDNPRWVANMVPLSKEQAKKMGETHSQIIGEDDHRRYVQWMTTKTNYGAPMSQWFRREPNGLLTRVDLVESGRDAKAKKAGQAGGARDVAA